MPVNYLIQNVHTEESIYNLSEKLNQLGVHGNIATNNETIIEHDNMIFLVYYMNITSYGQAKNNISASELRNELKNYGIDYYFIWDNSNQSSYMMGYNEITNGNIMNLKIYSLNR